MKAFLKGFDRKDEKFILGALRTTEFEPAERMIRKGTKDRSLIFISGGSFICFKDLENQIFKEGAVLGIEQFLHGKEWENDIICNS